MVSLDFLYIKVRQNVLRDTDLYRYFCQYKFVIEKFVLHDMRRTASTHLHEAGYNSDWIEKALAHE